MERHEMTTNRRKTTSRRYYKEAQNDRKVTQTMQLHLFQSLSHNPFMFHKQHMFGEQAADSAAAALHTLYDLVLELSGSNLTLSLWTKCLSG